MKSGARATGRRLAGLAAVGLAAFQVAACDGAIEPSDLDWLAEFDPWVIGVIAAALVLGSILLFRRRRPQPGEPDPASMPATAIQESISQSQSKRMSPGCMAGIFGVFLLFGVGFSLFFVVPAFQNLQARSWAPVECEILESRVESGSGDGDTYSVEVRYRYRWEGAEYESDRHDFLGGASSGRSAKQEVVDGLPQGSTTTCWVDPEEPSEAVLYRGWSWPYLFVLLPLVFVLIGISGVVWSLTRARALKAGASGTGQALATPEGGVGSFRSIELPVIPEVQAGPVELEEAQSPLGKLGAIVFFAVFWNGIVGVFLWVGYSEWKETGEFSGCLALFLVPFVLVGILLLVSVPYQILALANPRPKLIVGEGGVPLGGSTSLQWSFRGASSRLRDLKIYLEGSESATYRRGTDTHTATRVFARVDITRIEGGMMVKSGGATVRVPAETMHSFSAKRNEVEWKIHLEASITHWPDVITEFPFVVLPPQERDDRWES